MKNTAHGHEAYKQVRANGGSKLEARKVMEVTSQKHTEQRIERQFGHSKSRYNDDVSDFDHPINDGGWHTADDL